MADLSFGASANVFIAAGQAVRVSTGGVATVQMLYGGPGGTDTITANTRDYGPYGVPAKIRITATSGTVNYREMDEDPGFSQSEASALRGLVSGAGKIAVGIFGQSNERGQVLPADRAAYPQAFGSLLRPGLFAPMAGNVILNSTSAGAHGGPWFKFFDDMLEWGYEVEFFNGSVGGMGMVVDAAGQVKTRANSTAYASRRNARDPDDMGYCGDLTVQGGKLFLCTTGRDRYAVRRSPWTAGINTGVGAKFDHVSNVGSQATAGSDPGTWAATALGGTVTDGTTVWTNIDDTNSFGFSNGQVFNENQSGIGFDPLGLCERLHMNMQRIQGVASRHIILCNAQSDAGIAGANYSTAMSAVGRFFLRRGYTVWFGLSCYTPTTSTANYDNLVSNLNVALAACQGDANWGSRALPGANLYQLMGSTGNMGSGGAWLQADNIHLNGAGALVAGGRWADRFKAVLPRLSLA